MNEIVKKTEEILQNEYGCALKTATTKELYNALSKAAMQSIATAWQKTKNDTGKRCGYLSAEFLVGRSVFANLQSLGALEEVRTVLKERGVDINRFEEVEDAALGNGGLGRLAACYLESGATIGIRMDGYGLRYRYGLFRQTFENGFQKEEGDDWLKWGDPWSVRTERDSVLISFADQTVRAVPYDMPVIGYGGETVNTLRLWQSEPVQEFDFHLFNDMRGEEIARRNFEATKITDVLYPNDNTLAGKMLRLRQQYFLCSASLQDLLRKYKKTNKPLSELSDFITLQLNDTHPVLAIPELLRLLSLEGMSFEDALAVANKVFCFTNHTIMAEALETWDEFAIREVLPEIWRQIFTLQQYMISQGLDTSRYFIMKDGRIHMANLAIYVCRKVNGVARIHTEILKTNTFKNWYELFPEKFINVTNGITPRRWLMLSSPAMANAITSRIGDGWKRDLSQISALMPYVEDDEFLAEFTAIKRENKARLAKHIFQHEGVAISPDFIFDVQTKRLHEYKRQLLNGLSILYIYNGIKDGSIQNFKPTAFIFGAKAAPGYYMAKAVIKFINEVAKKVNGDPAVQHLMRVVFVQNYNVSYAEKIMCAADISEQISMAGMEASGTGNMKFMLNGTVTLGTMDGANVEICEEAGRENNYIFGATVEEVAEVKKYYNPRAIAESDPALMRVLNALVDGTLDASGSNMLSDIYHSLLDGYAPDHYLVLHDFADYVRTKLRLISEYGSKEFTQKCVRNMASSGKFSSDRSVKEYAEEIWKL
ncbi:MAG: glycogen/starch/alpha-glucan phosphorylase [Clostridia bacterium]|nr:glycogen/starch/alpha-glucan phosphorylase [Clostridia bacterium]